MLKCRVCLSEVTKDDWTTEHDLHLANYVRDPSQKVLIVYSDKERGLQVRDSFPTTPVSELCYFLKMADQVVSKENLLQVVQFGTLIPDHVNGLLRVMDAIYTPVFFANTTWPEGIRCMYCLLIICFLA